MPRLRLVTVATSTPMGAEVYQEQVAARADAALAADDGSRWQVERAVVRSIRSELPGSMRLPMGPLARSSSSVRRMAGRAVHPRDAVVHRMSLEIPPSPHADVVTLHDVVAWTHADESAPVRAAGEELRRAAAVVCVSSFSAGEAVALLGIDPPHVIPNGVDESFFDARPAGPSVLARLGVPGPFVLTTGGASERKNLVGLARAWPTVRAARPNLTLMLTGPEHPRRTALFSGVAGVRMTGMVDAGLMPALMAAATAVVVPSLHEGFGFPAVEAMAAGTVVVAAARAALPEVVGDGGLLVEPDPKSLAAGIIEATSADAAVAAVAARGRRRADDFTWARSLQGHAQIWRSVR